MYLQMHDCLTTTIVFTITNIIQFGVVIKVLTPPMVCYSSCLISAFTGFTFLPCFLVMMHALHKWRIDFVSKIVIISGTSFVPFASALSACVALHSCMDTNWYVWLIQGTTIPGITWTTYKMMF